MLLLFYVRKLCAYSFVQNNYAEECSKQKSKYSQNACFTKKYVKSKEAACIMQAAFVVQ